MSLNNFNTVIKEKNYNVDEPYKYINTPIGSRIKSVTKTTMLSPPNKISKIIPK